MVFSRDRKVRILFPLPIVVSRVGTEGEEKLLVAGFRAAARRSASSRGSSLGLGGDWVWVTPTESAAQTGSCRSLTGKECRSGLPRVGESSADPGVVQDSGEITLCSPLCWNR